MESLILLGYELLTVVLPAMSVMAIFMSAYKRNGVKTKRKYVLSIIIFALYIFAMFHVTGAGTIFELKQYGLEIKSEQISLLPFSDSNINVVTHGLNVILFIPFGFLLPFIWESMRRFIYTLVSGAMLSLLIELSQLLNSRVTDIDDLILNTVGTVAGFVLFRIFFMKTRENETPQGILRYEPLIYLEAMFICRFLIYNEFGAARLLYGF